MATKESTDATAISNRMGDLLVSEGLITYDQLNFCLEEQKKTGAKLNAIVVKQGLVDEDKLTEFISKQCGFKYVDLDNMNFKKEVLDKLPEKLIRVKRLIPTAFADDAITVAISDPLNIVSVDEIKITTGYKVNIVIASDGDIDRAIERIYGKEGETAKDALEGLKKAAGGDVVVEEAKGPPPEEEDGITTLGDEEAVPVVQIVNLILGRAVKTRASDIHIEAYQKILRVRYRMDGVLHEQPAPPKRFLNAIMSRLKIMANLDIAERRRPQDGRIKIRIDGKDIDLRLSICPCAGGEKAVMRIMDASAMTVDINKLGMDPENFAIFTKRMQDPHGIILVTGPTGSGKSTTLYSTLNALNDPETNIMTAEDPVEFQMHGINQVHCLSEIGLNFAAALRSFLRQDPDIIMVGEMRDKETVEIGINAALTGHLVFSTLHTNDAPGAITRILMMGIDPVLISSALTMVIAQRLLRRICKECKEPYEVETSWLASLGVQQKRLPSTPKATLYRGKGCENCNNSGYRGRMGVHEVLEVTDEIRDMICQRATGLKIKETAIRKGMITIQESSLRKLLDGSTSAEEVIRIIGAHA